MLSRLLSFNSVNYFITSVTVMIKITCFFVLVVSSFCLISISRNEENLLELENHAVCEERVNSIFCRGFGDVTRRVIQGRRFGTRKVFNNQLCLFSQKRLKSHAFKMKQWLCLVTPHTHSPSISVFQLITVPQMTVLQTAQ